jgi:hypothetical protein
MNSEERAFPDLLDNGNIIKTVDSERNYTLDNAFDYAKILTGNPCGNWGAKSLHLKNISSDKKINVTVEIKWVYQNKPMVESRMYTLFAQQQIELGCPIPGPTSQRFDFSIVAAWFLK